MMELLDEQYSLYHRVSKFIEFIMKWWDLGSFCFSDLVQSASISYDYDGTAHWTDCAGNCLLFFCSHIFCSILIFSSIYFFQAVISNKRLKEFFIADELDPDVVERHLKHDGKYLLLFNQFVMSNKTRCLKELIISVLLSRSSPSSPLLKAHHCYSNRRF